MARLLWVAKTNGLHAALAEYDRAAAAGRHGGPQALRSEGGRPILAYDALQKRLLGKLCQRRARNAAAALAVDQRNHGSQPKLGQCCRAEIDAEYAFLLAAQEKASTLGSQIAFSSTGFRLRSSNRSGTA